MLTDREKEVYLLKKRGFRQLDIAKRLKISQPAVSGFYKGAENKIRKAKETISGSEELGFLTKKEKRVLELKKEGKLQQFISKKLKISQPAVSGFYNNALKKIDAAKEILEFLKGVKKW